jgi:hypothetical protein
MGLMAAYKSIDHLKECFEELMELFPDSGSPTGLSPSLGSSYEAGGMFNVSSPVERSYLHSQFADEVLFAHEK